MPATLTQYTIVYSLYSKTCGMCVYDCAIGVGMCSHDEVCITRAVSEVACSESVSCSNVLQLLGNLRVEEGTPNQDKLYHHTHT